MPIYAEEKYLEKIDSYRKKWPSEKTSLSSEDAIRLLKEIPGHLEAPYMMTISGIQNCVREEYSEFLSILEYDTFYHSSGKIPVHNMIVVENDTCLFHMQARENNGYTHIDIDGVRLVEPQSFVSKRWVQIVSDGRLVDDYTNYSIFGHLLMESYFHYPDPRNPKVVDCFTRNNQLSFQYDKERNVQGVCISGMCTLQEQEFLSEAPTKNELAAKVEEEINFAFAPVERAFSFLGYVEDGKKAVKKMNKSL